MAGPVTAVSSALLAIGVGPAGSTLSWRTTPAGVPAGAAVVAAACSRLASASRSLDATPGLTGMFWAEISCCISIVRSTWASRSVTCLLVSSWRFSFCWPAALSSWGSAETSGPTTLDSTGPASAPISTSSIPKIIGRAYDGLNRLSCRISTESTFASATGAAAAVAEPAPAVAAAAAGAVTAAATGATVAETGVVTGAATVGVPGWASAPSTERSRLVNSAVVGSAGAAGAPAGWLSMPSTTGAAACTAWPIRSAMLTGRENVSIALDTGTIRGAAGVIVRDAWTAGV